MSVIYLDNNATTSVAPEVFESMIPFFTEKYGNASSMHTFGGQVGKSIQDAREKVAAMLGAQPEEIVFTSCGTESDSTAVMSALQAQPEKKHVITTRVEHSALIALGQASFLLIWPRCRWTFWRFPGTSSTPPRGSECCMSARERGSSRFFAAGIRKGGVVPARKTRRTS